MNIDFLLRSTARRPTGVLNSFKIFNFLLEITDNFFFFVFLCVYILILTLTGKLKFSHKKLFYCQNVCNFNGKIWLDFGVFNSQLKNVNQKKKIEWVCEKLLDRVVIDNKLKLGIKVYINKLHLCVMF